MGSSLRSPAEGEGHEGFPPPPDKDLESIHGIFQARVLEWGAIAFSNHSLLLLLLLLSRFSCVRLCATP